MFSVAQIKKIEKIIKRIPEDSPSGYECIFVKLNNKYGLKIYDERVIRDSCYYWQQKAFRVGAGPRVYDKIDLAPSFIYITEIITPLLDLTDRNDRYYKKRKYLENKSKWYRKQYKELGIKLEKIGFNTEDLAVYNVGLKGRTLLCIDFGCQYQCEYDSVTDTIFYWDDALKESI